MIHPPQDADTIPERRVTGVLVFVIVAIVMCGLAAAWIESCGTRGRSQWRAAKGPAIPDDVSGMETRVFPVQAQGIEMNQRAEQLLSTYSWVDRDRGIIRVPIEVGYQLLLQRQRGGTR